MTLVDTSVWIDFLEGREHWSKERLKEKINQRASIGYTEMILLEIIQGIHKQSERVQIEEQFGHFVLLPHRRSTSLLAADIYQELQRKGIRIRSIVDCLIAATAIETGTMILHKDRDFGHIAEHYPVICEKE